MTSTIEEIKNNFLFLLTDIKNQFFLTFEFLHNPNASLYDKITIRDDYIDNLKNIIENKCFSYITSSFNIPDKRKVNYIRAIHIIAINLERIADFCVNIVRQVEHLSSHLFLYPFDFKGKFYFLRQGLDKVLSALEDRDLGDALAICRLEPRADEEYAIIFRNILELLKKDSKNAGDYITTIFIARYFERIGDSLLNIGEAILFYLLGEKIKIHQFLALQKTLKKQGYKGTPLDVDFQSIWGSRSGCRIGRIAQGDVSNNFAKSIIFKEGTIKKIKQEKENLEKWQRIFPGLVPKIYSYYEGEKTASMLVEFLPGCGLDEIILNFDKDIVYNALSLLKQTLTSVWNTTIKKEATAINYIQQALDRRDSVYSIHPQFQQSPVKIGDFIVYSMDELFKKTLVVEKEIHAPFSVFIHGDFNTNNILYSHLEQKIYFIDVYRSRDYDYIQDVSVFLVSVFRMPIFDEKIRTCMNEVIKIFYKFAKNYAVEHQDSTFDVRLALALARSFFTSTRFELNKFFAEQMFIRAKYLLEKIVNFNGEKWEEFCFLEDILYWSF